MPRENPNGDSMPNPAKYFYSWSGEDGSFRYYDKENKKNITVDISEKPFTFLVLDILSTIKGYSEADKCGFWSNEVRDTTKEVLVVKTSNGVVAKGVYGDIKDKIKAKGAKFSISVYAAMKNADGALEIVNIQMYGSAGSAWMDFVKKHKVYELAVAVKKAEKKKKGKTEYFIPVFEPMKISSKTDDEAAVLQKELKEYLTSYFARNTNNAMTETMASDSTPKTTKSEEKEEEPAPWSFEDNDNFDDLPY
jgi:hypothetical protein